MILVSVARGTVHENVTTGQDAPAIALATSRGDALGCCHQLEIMDHEGRVVATLKSDMSDTPRPTPHVWLEVFGPYRPLGRNVEGR